MGTVHPFPSSGPSSSTDSASVDLEAVAFTLDLFLYAEGLKGEVTAKTNLTIEGEKYAVSARSNIPSPISPHFDFSVELVGNNAQPLPFKDAKIVLFPRDANGEVNYSQGTASELHNQSSWTVSGLDRQKAYEIALAYSVEEKK